MASRYLRRILPNGLAVGVAAPLALVLAGCLDSGSSPAPVVDSSSPTLAVAKAVCGTGDTPEPDL